MFNVQQGTSVQGYTLLHLACLDLQLYSCMSRSRVFILCKRHESRCRSDRKNACCKCVNFRLEYTFVCLIFSYLYGPLEMIAVL